MCATVHMQRSVDSFCELGSLLLLNRFWWLNSDNQACTVSTLPAEPCHSPLNRFLKFTLPILSCGDFILPLVFPSWSTINLAHDLQSSFGSKRSFLEQISCLFSITDKFMFCCTILYSSQMTWVLFSENGFSTTVMKKQCFALSYWYTNKYVIIFLFFLCRVYVCICSCVYVR